MCFKKKKTKESYFERVEKAKVLVSNFENKSVDQTTKILIKIASVDHKDIQYLCTSKKAVET